MARIGADDHSLVRGDFQARWIVKVEIRDGGGMIH